MQCKWMFINNSILLKVSQAVVPLVLWIAALVDYRKAKAAVQPYRDQLREAEETLTFAQEVYVTMRQDMLATKAALEVQHIQHKEALKKFKAIEADVKVQYIYYDHCLGAASYVNVHV